jgi:putative phosphoribosyl transferase
MIVEETLAIELAHGLRVGADLQVPRDARGVVAFAHGSGSSRFSPRNQQVATTLNERGFATLLVDLLTPDEQMDADQSAKLRFDVELLAARFATAVTAGTNRPALRDLPIGYFGASTGAAAALIAAGMEQGDVAAVVSRGGRPDLAGTHLSNVRAPTLLIVGERDEQVLALNRKAQESLTATSCKLDVVPGATHLFEEAGTLEEVTRLAGDWFDAYLRGVTRRLRRQLWRSA